MVNNSNHSDNYILLSTNGFFYFWSQYYWQVTIVKHLELDKTIMIFSKIMAQQLCEEQDQQNGICGTIAHQSSFPFLTFRDGNKKKRLKLRDRSSTFKNLLVQLLTQLSCHYCWESIHKFYSDWNCKLYIIDFRLWVTTSSTNFVYIWTNCFFM